jgi:ATP-dependent exoDNAse (exonuclease V) beta subunit
MTAFRPLIIRVSAGTGKTFQLSNRYLYLLFRGVGPETILATTFTRKAAGEILDRVVERLAGAAATDKAAAALAEQLADPSITRARCVEVLVELLRNLHRLRISTMDSLFAHLASSHSLELGLPPGWEILDDIPNAQLRRRAVEQLLREDSDRDIVRLLHLMAQGDVQRSVSQLLQDTIRELYAIFLETDAAAWSQFPAWSALTAEEVGGVIESLQAESYDNDKRMTNARDADLVRFRSEDWEDFIGKGLAVKVVEGDPRYYNKPIPKSSVDLYERLVGHARAVIVGRLAAQTKATYDLLARFHAIFESLKLDEGRLRFEDVTRILARGLSDEAAIGGFDFRLDARVAHVLLDEFQDTSLPQWQAIRPFASRAVSNSAASPRLAASGGQGADAAISDTPRGSFFCVGDEKQAIYAWRGGRAEIFAALESEIPGVDRATLAESFRSAPAIIAAVNRVFEHLPSHNHLERFESHVRCWCEAVPRHTTVHRDRAGYVTLETAPRAEEAALQSAQTLAHAADRIAALVAQSPRRSVGVLARKNDAVARLIYELRQRGVAASEEGGNPLTDSVAVQAVLSLLHLADHPGDTVARFHLATSPLGAMLEFTDHRDNAAAASLANHVRRALSEQGYGPTMARWTNDLRPQLGPRDYQRMEQLVELAYGYQSAATLRATDFIRYVESQRVADPLVAPVRVMTVHQSKGLQFDVVVLPDLDGSATGQPSTFVTHQPHPTRPVERVCLYRSASVQKLLPDDIRRMFEDEDRKQISESLCVLYVAITRAIRGLHMVIAPSRNSETNLPRSHAGFLRAALTDSQAAPPEAILYQQGDPDWHLRSAVEPCTMPVPQVRPEIALRRPADHRRRGRDRAAPSGLESKDRQSVVDALRTGNATGQQFGTLIHAWFEQIGWLPDDAPTDDQLRRIAEEQETGELNVEDCLRRFQQLLRSASVAKLLRKEEYLAAAAHRELGSVSRAAELRVDVEREYPFAVQRENQLLTGFVDRLLLIREGDRLLAADIVDYKTDTIDLADPRTLQAAVEKYRPQQLAYRNAIAQLFQLPLDQIHARLLFVTANLEVPIA